MEERKQVNVQNVLIGHLDMKTSALTGFRKFKIKRTEKLLSTLSEGTFFLLLCSQRVNSRCLGIN